MTLIENVTLDIDIAKSVKTLHQPKSAVMCGWTICNETKLSANKSNKIKLSRLVTKPKTDNPFVQATNKVRQLFGKKT